MFPQSSKEFCFTNALRQFTLPTFGGGGSYFREQTKISPIMSVMHQIPGVALSLVSPQKLEGDTVNIFNTRGHVQANIEDFSSPLLFPFFVSLSHSHSPLCFSNVCAVEDKSKALFY